MNRFTRALGTALMMSACTHSGASLDEHPRSTPVVYELTRHPESGVEMPRIRLPERPEIEGDINASLDAAAADLMCLPSDEEQDETSFESDIEVTYAANDILSVAIHASYYCGGAHPVNGADFSMTFDLVTGKKVSFRQLFQDYERDAEQISSIYLSSLSPDDLEGCEDVLTAETLAMYRFNFALSAQGVNIHPGFPTLFAACAHRALLTFEQLTPFAAPRGILIRTSDRSH